MRPVQFRFEDTTPPRRSKLLIRRFRTFIIRDGVETDAGVIELRRVPHLEHGGSEVHLWRATGNDPAYAGERWGDHRSFHVHSWQAALALAWDGKAPYGTPFKRPAWLTGTYP